jgi:hypothetical protein
MFRNVPLPYSILALSGLSQIRFKVWIDVERNRGLDVCMTLVSILTFQGWENEYLSYTLATFLDDSQILK